MKHELMVVYQLWKREIYHFLRHSGRILGSIGQPLLLWILLGTGVGATFQMKNQPHNVDFLEYFLPGIILMILLFTTIFSTISIIEDRKEGLLRTVLIAPVSRFSIVLGLCAGGITIAVLQGTIMLGVLPFTSLSITMLRAGYLIGVMFLISLGISSLGLFMAWFFESTQAYHGVMNFLLIPMWMLSGAIFPIQDLPGWLSVTMYANPLTYGLEAFRIGFYSNFTPPGSLQLHDPVFNLIVFGVFALLMFGIASFACIKKTYNPS